MQTRTADLFRSDFGMGVDSVRCQDIPLAYIALGSSIHFGRGGFVLRLHRSMVQAQVSLRFPIDAPRYRFARGPQFGLHGVLNMWRDWRAGRIWPPWRSNVIARWVSFTELQDSTK